MKLSEKRLNIKSILIITVILPVFVIAVSSVAIYITAKSVQPGSVLDMKVLSEEKHNHPETKDAALKMLEDFADFAVSSGILKYNGRTEVSLDSIECENAAVSDILSFASSSITGKMAEKYDPLSIKYGEDASAVKGLLPGSVPSDFEFTCEKGEFSLTLSFNSVFGNMYFLGDDKTAVSLFSKENESVFSALGEKFVPSDVKYIMTGNEKSGEIKTLSVIRTYDYSANISFRNTLSEIGATPLKMTLTFKDIYDFSFAGIEIQEDIMTFDKNGYDTLTVTPFTEDNLSEDEYTLEFISSDEGVATVDENGQVTAVKESEKPVTVTVKLSYLGKTFTDSCLIYVVKAVDDIKISETEKSLKVGEKFTLEATVSPNDATIKETGFISSDESIVKVSDTGEITAVAEGTATVTAYSKQGLLSAECTVTVTN